MRIETTNILKNRIESKPNLNDKIKIYNEEQYEYDNESEKIKKNKIRVEIE